MSEAPTVELSTREIALLRDRVLNLYAAVIVLCFVGIGVLIAYSISLGPILGPGVNESFGIAVALMFLMGALLSHVMDRAYREWPLGRRVPPPTPRRLGDRDVMVALRWVIVAAAAALLAYLFVLVWS